jgi:hypothetical protein
MLPTGMHVHKKIVYRSIQLRRKHSILSPQPTMMLLCSMGWSYVVTFYLSNFYSKFRIIVLQQNRYTYLLILLMHTWKILLLPVPLRLLLEEKENNFSTYFIFKLIVKKGVGGVYYITLSWML